MPKFPRVSSARSSYISRYILRGYGRFFGHLLGPIFWLASLRKISCIISTWPGQMTAMISSMFGRFPAPLTMTGQTHLRLVVLESSAIQLADPYMVGGFGGQYSLPVASSFGRGAGAGEGREVGRGACFNRCISFYNSASSLNNEASSRLGALRGCLGSLASNNRSHTYKWSEQNGERT
jgi:hypothetical protein